MKNKYKHMPLFSIDYLVTPYFYGNTIRAWIEMACLGGCLEGVCRTISGTSQDWASLNPMNNILVLPIAIPVMRALYLAANMLYHRSDVIHERNRAIDMASQESEFTRVWYALKGQMYKNSAFFDISVGLLKNRIANNTQYFFDEVLKQAHDMPQEFNGRSKFEEIILKTHLKKHPGDINRVLVAYDQQALPKSIQKYCGR